MRTGLYGGSFDPIHIGHVCAANEVLHRRALDRVVFVPAGSPPHKPTGCIAPFADRLAMARLAAAPLHGLEVYEGEGARDGPSYSIDTLLEWRQLHPEDQCELLVGADMLADLPRWKQAADIVKNALIVAFARPGEELSDALRTFEAAFGPGHAVLVEIPLVEASSTDVRARIGRGLAVDGLVPPEVAAYLRESRLYSGLTPGERRG
ncbi:MAG: nicotinate-nucleotide adenylyltransferase [Planctomycetota bacterium]